MIPIYVLNKGQTLEQVESRTEAKIYYLLAKDGLYLRRSNPLYQAIDKVKEVPHLGEMATALELSAKPVPRKLLDEVTAFLAEVCRRHEAEGVVLLYYHPTKQEWQYIVPEQKTTPKGLSVSYETPDTPEGWTLFGSVHSHARCGASQSGTDHKDEINFDGVHITVGHLPDNPDYHVRFCACGSTWSFKDQDTLVEPAVKQSIPVPEELLEKVKLRTYQARETSPMWEDEDWEKWSGYGTCDQAGNLRPDPSHAGKIFCKKQNRWVPPPESKDDWFQPGSMTTYRGITYRKTKEGWRAETQKDKRKSKKRKNKGKCPDPTVAGGERPSTPGTISFLMQDDAYEQYLDIEPETLNEIDDVREQFFRCAGMSKVSFGGLDMIRTADGLLFLHEIDMGRWVLTEEAFARMTDLLSKNAQEHLYEMGLDFLTDMRLIGWTPHDIWMEECLHQAGGGT